MGYVVADLAGYRAADLHPVVSGAFADYVVPLRTDAASLDALRHAAPGRIALTTVDAQGQVLCSWLARSGAELTLSQDEMVHEGP
jgi:hypothetical protein